MARVSYSRTSVSNLPATQPVSGTVDVGNLPAIQKQARALNLRTVTQTITRPANTTAYTAGDLLGPSGTFDAFELSGVSATAGQLVALRGVRMAKNSTGVTSSTLRLTTYNVKPTSLNGGSDNSPSALSFADMQNMKTFNTAGAFTAAGNAAYSSLNVTESTATMTTGTNGSLWASWEVTGAYTPASGEQFYFEYLFEVLE